MTNPNLKIAKIHGVRYLGAYGFTSLSATLTDQGTGGGEIFVPKGIHTVTTRVMIPKDGTTLIAGTGAPSQEPDMYSDGGSILNSIDANGLLYVETPPTTSLTTQILLRDIEFRQNVQQTSKSTICVSLDGAYIGGIERCNVFNINAKSGVAYPMNGVGLSMNNGSLGDKLWARDVTVGGFGGPEADPAYGLMTVGSNHFVLDDLHLNGMNKKVACGIYIHAAGARSRISSVSFFQLGTSGNTTNFVFLMMSAIQSSVLTSTSILISDINIESYYPRNDQRYGFYSADSKMKYILDRAYNSNFASWNVYRSNQPGGLMLREKVCGGTSASLCPIGFVTNFVDETNSLFSPSPTGASLDSVPNSATTYTCEVRCSTLYMSGGTVSALSVNGVSLVYVSGMSVRLQPGDTFVITYTVAPTFSSYWEV